MAPKPRRQTSKGAPGEWAVATRVCLQDPEHDDAPAAQGRLKSEHWKVAERKTLVSLMKSGASRPQEQDLEQMKVAYRNVINRANLQLACFEPLANTSMICGRPVQVFRKNYVLRSTTASHGIGFCRVRRHL